MSRRQHAAYSLAELVVVVGIVASLTAILLPAVGRARGAARATACLSNVREWGAALQMYAAANHGHRPVEPIGPGWWVTPLSPYCDSRAVLLCPEASESPAAMPRPGTAMAGSAATAWAGVTRDGSVFRGSYGFNMWASEYPHPGAPEEAAWPLRNPVRESDRVPVLGDCAWPYTYPANGDRVPHDLHGPEQGTSVGVSQYCLDRHPMAVNLAFLDGHAERVPLAGLWRLRWNETFTPQEVTVPGE